MNLDSRFSNNGDLDRCWSWWTVIRINDARYSDCARFDFVVRNGHRRPNCLLSSKVLSGSATSSCDWPGYFDRWYHENLDRDDCLDGRLCRRAPRFAKILRRYDRIGARWLQSRRSEIHGASRLSCWCAARFSWLRSCDIFVFLARNSVLRCERPIPLGCFDNRLLNPDVFS